MDFSTNLKNLRISRRLTQLDLANALGSTQSAVASYETGRREPSIETIQRIADYFQVPISTLILSHGDRADEVATESFFQNKKMKTLFEIVQNFSDDDLDAMITIAKAIQARR